MDRSREDRMEEKAGTLQSRAPFIYNTGAVRE
jgi:hypothetical protein